MRLRDRLAVPGRGIVILATFGGNHETAAIVQRDLVEAEHCPHGLGLTMQQNFVRAFVHGVDIFSRSAAKQRLHAQGVIGVGEIHDLGQDLVFDFCGIDVHKGAERFRRIQNLAVFVEDETGFVFIHLSLGSGRSARAGGGFRCGPARLRSIFGSHEQCLLKYQS